MPSTKRVSTTRGSKSVKSMEWRSARAAPPPGSSLPGRPGACAPSPAGVRRRRRCSRCPQRPAQCGGSLRPARRGSAVRCREAGGGLGGGRIRRFPTGHDLREEGQARGGGHSMTASRPGPRTPPGRLPGGAATGAVRRVKPEPTAASRVPSPPSATGIRMTSRLSPVASCRPPRGAGQPPAQTVTLELVRRDHDPHVTTALPGWRWGRRRWSRPVPRTRRPR